MRKPLPLWLLVLLPALALANGQRWVETSGQAPSVCDTSANGGDGLALRDVTACRASIRAIDGGDVNGGKLIPYYCEVGSGTAGAWHEGSAAGQCTLETGSKVDGGARVLQTCEWTVINPFGRVAVAAWGITSADGGTGRGLGSDGGWNVRPVVRLECTGPMLAMPSGATP